MLNLTHTCGKQTNLNLALSRGCQKKSNITGIWGPPEVFKKNSKTIYGFAVTVVCVQKRFQRARSSEASFVILTSSEASFVIQLWSLICDPIDRLWICISIHNIHKWKKKLKLETAAQIYFLELHLNSRKSIWAQLNFNFLICWYCGKKLMHRYKIDQHEWCCRAARAPKLLFCAHAVVVAKPQYFLLFFCHL